MFKKVLMTGMILAGGKSSRMGKDKALLPFGEGSVLEHLGKLFDFIFEQTLIVVSERTMYGHLDLPQKFFVEDLAKNKGPLGGLSTGFSHADYPYCFVATCDMPLLHERFIQGMIKARTTEAADVLCTQNKAGRWEPFPAIYCRENRSLVQALLDLGHLSMGRLLELISVAGWAMPEEFRNTMINMNSPADYEAVIKMRKELCEH